MADTTPTMWRKSSHSDQSECVEVAVRSRQLLVRDSKNPGGPRLTVPAAAWENLTAQIKHGRFDF
jgi:hypothetical protein